MKPGSPALSLTEPRKTFPTLRNPTFDCRAMREIASGVLNKYLWSGKATRRDGDESDE
jgi:hypothetical protein